jgi:hypothetical protein
VAVLPLTELLGLYVKVVKAGDEVIVTLGGVADVADPSIAKPPALVVATTKADD